MLEQHPAGYASAFSGFTARDEERKLMNMLPSGCTFLVRLGKDGDVLVLVFLITVPVFLLLPSFYLFFFVSVLVWIRGEEERIQRFQKSPL